MKRLIARPIKYLHRGVPAKLFLLSQLALIFTTSVLSIAIYREYTPTAVADTEIFYSDLIDQETAKVMRMGSFKEYMETEARHIALQALAIKTSNEQIALDNNE